MNAQQIQELRLSTIAQFDAQRAELNELLRAIEDGRQSGGWVVISAGGFALTFDVDTRGGVTNPRPMGGPGKATRFTEANAKKVAKVVLDGSGAASTAKHVKQAIADEIAQLTKSINDLQAIADREAAK